MKRDSVGDSYVRKNRVHYFLPYFDDIGVQEKKNKNSKMVALYLISCVFPSPISALCEEVIPRAETGTPGAGPPRFFFFLNTVMMRMEESRATAPA